MNKEEKVILELVEDRLPRVTRYINGIAVEQKDVYTDDLINALLDIAYVQDVLEYVIEDEDYETAFAGIIEEFDEKQLDTLLETLFRRVSLMSDSSVLVKVLTVLIEKINMVSVESSLIGPLLDRILEVVQYEEREKALRPFFDILLPRIPKGWIQELMDKAGRRKLAQTPILPKNCVYWSEMSDGYDILLEIEKSRQDVTYYETVIKDVGHPKSLFLFEIHKGKAETRIYAVKDVVIKPSTKLYYWPFSNVYQDGRACWPELRSMELNELHRLTTLPYLFFTSPSNNDLYRGTKNFRGLLEELSSHDFDDSILIPTGLKVEDII